MRYYKHPSAIVDEGAQIGDGSRVWHFVHVCGGARMGKDAMDFVKDARRSARFRGEGERTAARILHDA